MLNDGNQIYDHNKYVQIQVLFVSLYPNELVLHCCSVLYVITKVAAALSQSYNVCKYFLSRIIASSSLSA